MWLQTAKSLMASNNRNLLAHSSGGYEIGIQMSVWLASLRRLQKESCMAYSSFWGLPLFFLAALPPSLPLPSHGLFLHETVFSSFMRALAVGFRSHPGIQDDLMSKLLYLIPAAKTLFFPKRSHLQPPGLQCKNLLGSNNPATSARLILFLNLISPHDWFIKSLKILLLRVPDN